MTGLTPSQVGIHDWLEEDDEAIAHRDWIGSTETLPTLLHRAGYHCILSGKWHLGRSHKVPPGFDRCFGLPRGQGIHNGEQSYHLDGRTLRLSGNKSRHITDHALAMLDDAPRDRPFFLNIGYIATHSPYDILCHDPAQRSEAEALILDGMSAYRRHPWAKNEGLNEGADEDPGILRRMVQGYYAAVREIDQNIGRVLTHLASRNLWEDTIIIYVSDHGCALGHHGFFGKGNSTRPLNMYDTSLRVPLFLAGPGIPGGTVVNEPVDHYDLFLAICEWAGTPPSRRSTHPGTSLVPLSKGLAVQGWQRERYGEYGDLRMIRTPEYKLIRRYNKGPDELFDLIGDPGETRNILLDPGRQRTRAHLEAELETWYVRFETPARSGLRVKDQPVHNLRDEAWRDGRREKLLRSL